jgi:hypothetical protein
LQKIAMTIKSEDVQKIHSALRSLAGFCDGAAARDGQGFDKIDAYIGHRLANTPSLTAKQAALGAKICKKYRRQLGTGIWSEMDV